VITIGTNALDYRSEAWIFDARRITAGPICRVRIPARVAPGVPRELGARTRTVGRAPAQPLRRGASARMRGSSVTRAIELIGDRWSILVVRDAFQGVRRFEDFLARTGASRATLTRRLRSLEARGILRRAASGSRSGHSEYRLTDMGRDLFPLSLVAWSWERRWAPRGAGIPATLRHASCGHEMRPQVVCDQCGGEVTLGRSSTGGDRGGCRA